MEINTSGEIRIKKQNTQHKKKQKTDYIIWNMPRYVVRFFGFCNYEYSSEIDKFNTLGL